MTAKNTYRTAEEYAKALKKSRRNHEEHQMIYDKLCSELDGISDELEYCDCLSEDDYRNLGERFDELVEVEEAEEEYLYLKSLTFTGKICRILRVYKCKIRRILGIKPKLVHKKMTDDRQKIVAEA